MCEKTEKGDFTVKGGILCIEEIMTGKDVIIESNKYLLYIANNFQKESLAITNLDNQSKS